MKFIKPTPIEKEIVLDPKKVIMSKTDAKGVIEFANDYFMEICGYEEYELMGKPHNVIRHPDMPRVIYKILWERLHKGKNIHAVVKNLAKDGSYYWVVTNFETKYDDNGNIISHYSRRKAAPKHVVKTIEKLYKVLLSLEVDDRSMKKSLNYFIGYFEEKYTTYDDFILDLIGTTEEEIQEYFNNPELNLNANENKKGINKVVKEKEIINKEKLAQLEKIEQEIKKLEAKVSEQKTPSIKKKKPSLFRRFFMGE